MVVSMSKVHWQQPIICLCVAQATQICREAETYVDVWWWLHGRHSLACLESGSLQIEGCGSQHSRAGFGERRTLGRKGVFSCMFIGTRTQA